jgi:hypothetical protein
LAGNVRFFLVCTCFAPLAVENEDTPKYTANASLVEILPAAGLKPISIGFVGQPEVRGPASRKILRKIHNHPEKFKKSLVQIRRTCFIEI